MNMKRIISYPLRKSTKYFIVCSLLLSLSFAATPVMAQSESSEFQVGDTIVFKRNGQRYLTGEKPSAWVYDYRHVIQQVGGIRFPQGILLRGIYSWMAPEGLQLVARKDTIKPVFLEKENEVTTEQSVQEHESDVEKPWIETPKETQPEQSTQPENVIVEDKVVEEQPNPVQASEPSETVTVPAEETKIAVEEEKAPTLPVEEPVAVPQIDSSRVEQKNDTIVEELPAPSVQAPVEEEQIVEENTDSVQELSSRMSSHHRFSIGLRGGVASLMHETDVMGNWRAGFDGLLDLQYAYYAGAKNGKKVNLGVVTGLSLGWAQSGLRAGVDTAYTVATSDGNIDYTISAKNVDEKDGQLQLEVPVMFSLLTENGFFLNIGPKFVLPVYKHFKQGISSPDINAYFPNEGVNVSNEVITGKVTNDQLTTKGKWNGSKLNVMLTAELGYEWALRNGDALGLGVYANYSLYDLYKNDTSNKSLINVTAPSASAPAAVNILSATDTYAKGLGYFDCGLKLVYHFQFLKK